MELYSLKTVNEIKKKHNFKNSKGLGQNFLVDKDIIDEIVKGSGVSKEDLVIEIGPGLGVLTAELAQRAGKVVAIEIDKRLLKILENLKSIYDNIDIINEDVLKLDLNRIIKDAGYSKAKIVGNLPYYITTPIIMHILESDVSAESITVMMQKEVADRIRADAGSRTYAAISVTVQYRCKIEKVIEVSKESFSPMPKVDSTVLNLFPRSEPEVYIENEDMFFACIKSAFGQRRKTIQNSLGNMGFEKARITEVLEYLNIDVRRRAETLSVKDFAALSNEFYRRFKR